MNVILAEKMDIVFATNNKNKIKEITSLLNQNINILSLSDINFFDEIPETSDTLKGNAFIKADFINKKFNYNCFADDTGLFIDALNGEPGVYSARYSGEEGNSKKNIEKVLKKLSGVKNRDAHFTTVISLILNGKKYFFEGSVFGRISNNIKGEQGFGYDPIFIPDGYDISFSQMDLSEKNKISHRAKAVKKLIEFLLKFSNEYNSNDIR